MKTKLIAVIALAAVVPANGGHSKSTAYRRNPGIDCVCSHDGKHGDEITLTIKHNGRTTSQTLATTELLEDRPDLIAQLARTVFNQTDNRPLYDNSYFWLIEYEVYKRGVLDQTGWARQVAVTRSEAIRRMHRDKSVEGRLRILSIKREELYRDSTQRFMP
jgi:hypothetical protein